MNTLKLWFEKLRANGFGGFLVDLAYHDQARLTEWVSLCYLINFAVEFTFNAELAKRDSYAGFTVTGLGYWAGYTTIAAALQIAAIGWQGRLRDDIRFCAMIVSCAFWIGVAGAFWSSGIETTANLAYTAFALNTFFATGFLLWKSTTKAG